MLHPLLESSGKSVWREIGLDMLRKGAATIAVETVRAGIDIVKQRRVRREVYEFDLWKKAQEKLKEDAEAKAKPESEVAVSTDEVPDPEAVAAPVETKPETRPPSQ